MRYLKPILASVVLILLGSHAQASNVLLTGHDVLLHSGQNGFDLVALDFIRGAGTDNEIARADFNIAVIGTAGTGSARFTGQGGNIPSLGHNAAIALTGTLAGFGSAVFWDAASITGADFATVDAIVILSHTSCGGCSLSTAGSDAINALRPDITTAFNDGMRIWANSGASLGTYYDFLPPGAVATGTPISGSSGFECTAAGAAIGFIGGTGCVGSPSMINGYPTHNRFTSATDAFSVFEIRPTAGIDELITIGLQGGTIIDDEIIITPPPTDPPSTVPTPAPLALMGTGLLGLALLRRRKALA